MHKKICLILFSIPLWLLSGCKGEEIKTYTIARKGVLISEENYDVIHVYGFVDNQEVASQLTDFLNSSEPNTYHYHEHRQ